METDDVTIDSINNSPATPATPATPGVGNSNPGTPRSMDVEVRATPPPMIVQPQVRPASSLVPPQLVPPREMPQSKYGQLLAVIEDMGRDIRPTYSGSKTSAERLKRGIVHARILVRECLMECERSART